MNTDRTFVIVCHGLAGVLVGPEPGFDPTGSYLKSYDPDAHDGYGTIEWTDELSEAKRYDSFIAVMEEWKRTPAVRPLRADGQPNRPLTAFNIEPRPVD